jgi:YggT family protein
MSALATLVLATTARERVAAFVGAFLTVYIILIFIRIVMSWLPRVPYYRWLDAVLRFVTETTDPWLNLFRRFVPSVGIGGAGLDLSPMVATLVLILLGRILVPLIAG